MEIHCRTENGEDIKKQNGRTIGYETMVGRMVRIAQKR